MMMLKNHVKNRARPEASIAQGYSLEETMGYATSYMHGYEAVRRRIWNEDPEDCEEYEVLEGAAVDVILSRSERDALHKFVLRNSTLTATLYRYFINSSPALYCSAHEFILISVALHVDTRRCKIF